MYLGASKKMKFYTSLQYIILKLIVAPVKIEIGKWRKGKKTIIEVTPFIMKPNKLLSFKGPSLERSCDSYTSQWTVGEQRAIYLPVLISSSPHLPLIKGLILWALTPLCIRVTCLWLGAQWMLCPHSNQEARDLGQEACSTSSRYVVRCVYVDWSPQYSCPMLGSLGTDPETETYIHIWCHYWYSRIYICHFTFCFLCIFFIIVVLLYCYL